MFNKPTSIPYRGEFVEDKLMLSCSFRCGPFHMDSITLLCYLSPNLDVQQTGLGAKLAENKLKIFKTKEQF
jgi:hypothetical protein